MRLQHSLLTSFVRAAMLIAMVPALAADDLRLQLHAPKTEVLVGEPVVIVARIETSLPVERQSDLALESNPFQVLVDRGQGFVRYQEWTSAAGWRDPVKHPLQGGRVLVEHVLSYDAKTQRWAFAQPGTYRIVAEYRDDVVPATRSNIISVDVSAPTGAEKEVQEALLQWGEQSLAFHVPNRIGAAGRDLLGRFPGSVYLQELRLNDLQSRLAEIANGFDPDSPPSSGNDDTPPTRPNFRSDVQRQRLTAVLPDAQDAAGVPGPFQPDAMILLAGIYESLGEDTSARALYERVAREFPDRKAGEAGRERIGDPTPPELVVTASPPSLWPPNHRLVPIAVAVEVRDDVDPNPTAKLESITCDDGCDPALDIVGADYEADDRQFALRAERKGTSAAGRTYTITYFAEDAAGNKTTASTTVVVPHDQGKKK